MQRPQIVKRVAFRLISVAVISCCMAGCSLFGSQSQSIGVSSDPPGAQVFVGEKLMGTTPVHFEVARGEFHIVEVRKPGYQTQSRALQRKMSALGMLDIVGGYLWLIPLVGLFSSASFEHDPAEIGITLEPEQKVAPTH
jgi:hypothetical protein